MNTLPATKTACVFCHSLQDIHQKYSCWLVILFCFFMTPFKKAHGNTAAPTVPQEALTNLLHLNSPSFRAPQSHSSNIVLIKKILLSLPPLSGRGKGTFWQAPSRDQGRQPNGCRVHSHHLRLVSTAARWNFCSNTSAQHSDRPATISNAAGLLLRTLHLSWQEQTDT